MRLSCPRRMRAPQRGSYKESLAPKLRRVTIRPPTGFVVWLIVISPLIVRSSESGTQDFRLSTSAGDLALTLWADMTFVGLWRRTWREPGEEILEEPARNANDLAALLQRAGVDTTEAADIAGSLWPNSA